MPTPQVSVVLPVFNGAADVATAVDSILTQTYADFELIIINDGSTDETAAVLESVCDPRVHIITQDNRGLAATLNRGIALARGKYIARIDHDDRAMPTRLEKQVHFMEGNPDYGMVGTRAEIWTGDRPTGRAHDHPLDDAALRFELLFDNYFVHSSILMRAAVLDAVGLYTTDPQRQPPEDYELWSRVARHFRVANLPERLTIYRQVENSISRTGTDPFMDKLVLICSENLAAACGEPIPGEVHRDIAALSHRARHLVSPEPDLSAMCHVIEYAGARIAANAYGCDVIRRVVARVDDLRANYGIYITHRKTWAEFGDGVQRTGLRRLARKLKMKRRAKMTATAAVKT